jgi:hypothetical protein
LSFEVRELDALLAELSPKVKACREELKEVVNALYGLHWQRHWHRPFPPKVDQPWHLKDEYRHHHVHRNVHRH